MFIYLINYGYLFNQIMFINSITLNLYLLNYFMSFKIFTFIYRI